MTSTRRDTRPASPGPTPSPSRTGLPPLWPAHRFGKATGTVGAWAPAAGVVPAETALHLGRIVRRQRLGGPAGLADPGPAALSTAPPTDRAVLVLDPCPRQPTPADRNAMARVMAAALAEAADRPVLVLPHPSAAPRARPLLAAWPGAHILPHRLAAWTLLDSAAVVHLAGPARDPPDPMAALAGAAGLPLRIDGLPQDSAAIWAAALAATAWTCPFHGTPITAEAGLALLGQWRAIEAQNRRIAAVTGIAVWKRAAIAPLLASSRGLPAFRAAPGAALKRAKRDRGTLAAWASAMPAALPAAAAEAEVPLLRIEDGFVRGRGLGARFQPGASWCLDGRGVHYDAARPSDLEALLAVAEFPPPLLARAASLRATITDRRISKYNPPGAPLPPLPDGRRILLVTGQVEDDASMRAVTGKVRRNLDLLRAVRAAEPGAFVLYKPHPDLVAGFRHGRIAAADLRGLADAVVTATPLPDLLPKIDALHTICSLSGFEALLRGVPVTCWGQPAYAGWGLTEDRDPIPRRTRRLTLDELVAGMLILYPRYVDPATGLPCGPEILLDRLDDAALWRAPRWTLHRGLQGFLTRLVAGWRGLT